MGLLDQLFRTDVVVVNTPQTAIINNGSVVTAPPCTASRYNLSGPYFRAGTFQAPPNYKGPIGKLVI
jgi:hypothetical protein